MFKRPFFNKRVDRGQIKSIDDNLIPVNRENSYIDYSSETNFEKKNQILKYGGIGLGTIASIAIMWNIALNNIKKDYSDLKEPVPVVLHVDTVQSYDDNLVYNDSPAGPDPEDDPLEKTVKAEISKIKKPYDNKPDKKYEDKKPEKKDPAWKTDFTKAEPAKQDTIEETIRASKNNDIALGYTNREGGDGPIEEVVKYSFATYTPWCGDGSENLFLIDKVSDILSTGHPKASKYLDYHEFDGLDLSKITGDGHVLKINLDKGASNMIELYPVTSSYHTLEVPDPSTITINGVPVDIEKLERNSIGQMIAYLSEDIEGGVLSYRTVFTNEFPDTEGNDLLKLLRDDFDFTDVPEDAAKRYQKAKNYFKKGNERSADRGIDEYVGNAGYATDNKSVNNVFKEWVLTNSDSLSFEEFLANVYKYNCNLANNLSAVLKRSVGFETMQMTGWQGSCGKISTENLHSIHIVYTENNWRAKDSTPWKRSEGEESGNLVIKYENHKGENWEFTEQDKKKRNFSKKKEKVLDWMVENAVDAEFEDITDNLGPEVETKELTRTYTPKKSINDIPNSKNRDSREPGYDEEPDLTGKEHKHFSISNVIFNTGIMKSPYYVLLAGGNGEHFIHEDQEIYYSSFEGTMNDNRFFISGGATISFDWLDLEIDATYSKKIGSNRFSYEDYWGYHEFEETMIKGSKGFEKDNNLARIFDSDQLDIEAKIGFGFSYNGEKHRVCFNWFNFGAIYTQRGIIEDLPANFEQNISSLSYFLDLIEVDYGRAIKNGSKNLGYININLNLRVNDDQKIPFSSNGSDDTTLNINSPAKITMSYVFPIKK
ncbi:hypothetical protein HQ529_00850 [Candidatus Woesearchaeota archaeon]|nr:hypothetical protein [Candidatus Woesearchaeota archaeon]